MKTILRDLSIVVLVTVVMMIASTVRGETGGAVRVRAAAYIDGDKVLLQDVAALQGVAPELATLTVARLPAGSTQLVVGADQVRQLLATQGVHWGHVTVSGFRQCTVHRAAPAAVAPAPETAAPVLANSQDQVDTTGPATLRDLLREKLAVHAVIPLDQLVITFPAGDEAALAASVLGHRVEVQPMASGGVGRVPLVVRFYDGEAVTATHRINADVAWRTLAVVVRRGLSRGQTLTDADVEVREVTLDEARAQPPLATLDLAVGQVADAVLREGAVLYPDDLRAPLLVRRGQLVTVRAMVGDLVVRTAGRATEDGGLDAVIAVRNERSRQMFTARVTGVQEVVVDAAASTKEGDGDGDSADRKAPREADHG